MNQYSNKLLLRLDADSIRRLELQPVKLEIERAIEEPDEEIKNLYFIESGIGSMTTTFRDGSQVEVGMFGCESVMGSSALLGIKRTLNRVYMQAEGEGYISHTPVAMKEFSRSGQFHNLVLRYLQAQLLQTAQSAGCNARHDSLQRLCRWLLMCSDRLQAEVLPLKQEFLADMLGTGRPTVSLAAETLQRMNLIEYSRGRLRILDRDGLEMRSCECYRVIRNYLEAYPDVDAAAFRVFPAALPTGVRGKASRWSVVSPYTCREPL